MSDHSNREKKRAARDGAAALRAKPGWDPRAQRSERPEERLRQLGQEARGEAAYARAGACEACAAARRALGDETALCDKHLAEAMGV